MRKLFFRVLVVSSTVLSLGASLCSCGDYSAARKKFVVSAKSQGLTADEAECMWQELRQDMTIEQLSGPQDRKYLKYYQKAAGACVHRNTFYGFSRSYGLNQQTKREIDKQRHDAGLLGY